MLRIPLALVICAALAGAAAAAPKAVAHKPAAKSAAPAARTAPASPTVDSGDPQSLVTLATSGGAKAQVAHKDADAVLVTVTTSYESFSVQYAGCNPDGRQCKAALFDSQAGGSPSLAQLNGFNQASAMCRGYLDKSGKAHVVMSTLLFPDELAGHLLTELSAWQACLAEFNGFAKDPVAYLANAP
jgi:hypothetical protein